MEKNGSSPNHLFYVSTPASVARPIIEGLGSTGLNRRDHGWTRIILEKPFGRDLKSAHALSDVVRGVFEENTVYRIDHYLGKETVQNILVSRFSNSLFEPVWNRSYIEYVEITAAERVGVENRAAFYEETGALRDMVANHLLQLLALTTMEPPVAFDADSVREQKARVLRSIRPMSVEDVARFTARGQYGSGMVDGKRLPGYRQEPGVHPKSTTETYAAVKFHIENWRWAGVPFYIRTGKRLARNLTEIRVRLTPTPQALFANTSSVIDPNVIAISIQPDEGISIAFDAKRLGTQMRTVTVQANFSYHASFGSKGPVAYETLLLDSMRGDATPFTRRDEVEAEWRIITPIEEAWAQLPTPDFPNYAAGSEGQPRGRNCSKSVAILPNIRETRHFKFDQGNFGNVQHRFCFPCFSSSPNSHSAICCILNRPMANKIRAGDGPGPRGGSVQLCLSFQSATLGLSDRRNNPGIVMRSFANILRRHRSSAYKVSLQAATTSHRTHLMR
jgi:glucose-6-phosphate 1-dehydrogenase